MCGGKISPSQKPLELQLNVLITELVFLFSRHREHEFETDVPQELIEKSGPIPGLDMVEDMDIDKPDPLDERK